MVVTSRYAKPGSTTRNYLPTFDYVRSSTASAAELRFCRLSSLAAECRQWPSCGLVADWLRTKIARVPPHSRWLSKSSIPPEQVLERRALLRRLKDLREQHTVWVQRTHVTLLHRARRRSPVTYSVRTTDAGSRRRTSYLRRADRRWPRAQAPARDQRCSSRGASTTLLLSANRT